MRFGEWVEKTGKSNAEIGRELGRSAMCISHWRRRERVPGKEDVAAIYRYTDGAVTPNDWYDLPELDADAAADRADDARECAA